MQKTSALFVSTVAFLLQASSASAVDFQDINNLGNQQNYTTEQTAPFKAFTGKITKNKVRLRQQPNVESAILKELSQGDFLIVVGETNDFYAVQPPAGTKAYVFRTYVLDNTIEGSRVNVRLEPDVDAPAIAQLKTGDLVEGVISPLNSKWLEIAPPSSARFYVAKDYITNVGDTSYLAKMEKRRGEVTALLNSAYISSQEELNKSFPEIDLTQIHADFNRVINDYPDFPSQVTQAKELLLTTQEAYLNKKIPYLEAQVQKSKEEGNNKSTELTEQVKTQQQKLSQLEQQLQRERGAKSLKPQNANDFSSFNGITAKMAAWQPIEQRLYDAWAATNDYRSQDDYYQEQQHQAVAIKGILEPYTRVINNKPGDYVLLSQASNLPIAYLYSTKVDLQNSVGNEVTVYVSPRPNNHFAFPAYFVFSVE